MFNIGAPQFGLRRGKIGTWVGDGTYDDVQDVPSIQVLSSNIQTVNAQLEGNDYITATAATAISGEVTLRFGSVDPRVLSLITGSNYDTYASTPNQYGVMRISGKNFPYVGIIGQSRAAEGGGDTHLFIPKVKATTGFEVRFEYGAFSIPEITMMSLPDENWLDAAGDPCIAFIIPHETATADVSLPPDVI
jgi:hypothetical protein